MDSAEQKAIKVEVVYALPEEQTLLAFDLPEGQTAKDAIELSGILQRYPDLIVDDLVVGLFGKKTKLTQVLREQDRVEIYRPLIADPKEVRKRKAAEGKKLKKGGSDTPNDKTA